MNDALCWLSAAELARSIRTKQVSTIDIVRAHRDRIVALNPRLNAIVTLNPHAEEEARAADAAVMNGHDLGPLHGVPFTVKDCINTAGLQTTRGSRLFADHVPSTDATAVLRLKAAGGILLAKTNVPEFSFDRETANAVFGRSVNPWNPNRTPGGSSGGEAVAIASGLSPLGVGSDLAVSIRGPAHYCGIVGLKPTHGRIPLSGHWPETLHRFWHVGPMARTVGDVTLALGIMSGPDGRDPHAWPLPPPGAIDAESPLPRLRVGWLAERGFGPVDQEVVATIGRAAQLLQEVGCEVAPGDPRGFEQRDCNALTAQVFRVEAGRYFESVVTGRHADLHPVMRRYLEIPAPSFDDYLAAERELEGLRYDLAAYFRDHDVLLCPVSPVPAFPHERDRLSIGGISLPARHVVRPTAPFNVTGSPALSVPFGWSHDRLPIGVQIVGRHLDEATILRVGMVLERHAEVRRPTLVARSRSLDPPSG